MKSWLTSLLGVVAGVATAAQHGFTDVTSLIAAAAIAFLGLAAKDSTGTTK